MSANEAIGFAPCGVISITTDFGHKGPFVGTMKGRILDLLPSANIVDLTHEILVHWPAEAGFWIERSYRYFPDGTVHIAVVDPGVGTDRSLLAVSLGSQVFLAPDNGLLAPLAGRTGAVARHVSDATLEALDLGKVSATFHGRDVFAPLAARLAAGMLKPADLGPVTGDYVPSWLDEPSVQGGRIKGVVISVDHFGNLITNIDARDVARLTSPEAHIGNHSVSFRRTYGDTTPGDYLALINSFDVVEIARAEQSAAEGLGAGRGAPVEVVGTVD